jgi:hypothetical protein
VVSKQNAVNAAKTILAYCNEQRSCQNCIFRLFGAESWKCHIQALDLKEILSNIEAKRKHGAYL